jgi:hypothetical protein
MGNSLPFGCMAEQSPGYAGSAPAASRRRALRGGQHGFPPPGRNRETLREGAAGAHMTSNVATWTGNSTPLLATGPGSAVSSFDHLAACLVTDRPLVCLGGSAWKRAGQESACRAFGLPGRVLLGREEAGLSDRLEGRLGAPCYGSRPRGDVRATFAGWHRRASKPARLQAFLALTCTLSIGVPNYPTTSPDHQKRRILGGCRVNGKRPPHVSSVRFCRCTDSPSGGWSRSSSCWIS